MPKAKKPSGATKAKPKAKVKPIPKKPTSKSVSISKLQSLGKEKKDEFFHAENTTKKYKQRASNAKKWLASFFDQERQAEDPTVNGPRQTMEGGEDKIGDTSPLSADPEFKTALDGKPVKCTPTVISMYLVQKCFEEDLGLSTASQIQAALIREYDELDGDTYRGRWHYNESQEIWIGNPVRSAEVDDVMKSIKHKCGADGADRKHSLPMTKRFMDKLYDWSTALSPVERPVQLSQNIEVMMNNMMHLRFRARAALGFTIWTRNCESTQLQYKHFEFDGERRRGGTPLDPPHFEINLKNRKNWQRKQDKNQSLCGHNYKVYPQTQRPSIDMYTNVLDWLDYYELLLGRRLQLEDYIFPFIGTDCKIHPHRAMSSDLVQKELNEFALKAGLPGAGSFTTHCYRRGGAQYKFMFAPVGERWTLARIRWWGGWAEKEHRDTLIRYLLDELYNYEEDHSDAMCPISREADKSLMGEAALIRPASTADLHELANRMDERTPAMIQQGIQQGLVIALQLAAVLPAVGNQQVTPHVLQSLMQGFTVGTTFPHSTVSASLPGLTSAIPTPRREAVLPRINFAFPIVPPPLVPYQPPALSAPPFRPNPSRIIPHIGRGADAWRAVVRDWEQPDESRSLPVPLREWTAAQIKEGGASIYKQREIVATEFIEKYQRDEEKFLDAYPQHKQGLVSLITAIRVARGDRGACKRRRSKNGSPEERGGESVSRSTH